MHVKLYVPQSKTDDFANQKCFQNKSKMLSMQIKLVLQQIQYAGF